MDLINWLWLEELLLEAAEEEVRLFGADHRTVPVYAFCLEYDGLEGALRFSFGTRDSVEEAARAAKAISTPTPYRGLELDPALWKYRDQGPHGNPDRWRQIRRQLDRYQRIMAGNPNGETIGFLWARLDAVCEGVVRALRDQDVFAALHREPEFLAFVTYEQETLWMLEERLAREYPNYRKAVAELIAPRSRRAVPGECSECGAPRRRPNRTMLRCTACDRWFCKDCGAAHRHPELEVRQPFFQEIHPPAGEQSGEVPEPDAGGTAGDEGGRE